MPRFASSCQQLPRRDTGHFSGIAAHLCLASRSPARDDAAVGRPKSESVDPCRGYRVADPVPDGVVTNYRADGSRLAEATYGRGILHGPYRDFWSHGGVSLEGQFRDGQQDGEWRFYDCDTGELREVLRFVAGREVIEWNERFGRARPEAY